MIVEVDSVIWLGVAMNLEVPWEVLAIFPDALEVMTEGTYATLWIF